MDIGEIEKVIEIEPVPAPVEKPVEAPEKEVVPA